jgi:hypothetical protein
MSENFVRPSGIRASSEITAFCESFLKAQKKFGAAIKGSVNPMFKSKYADLSAVIEAVLEHLNAEDIGVMQWPALDGQMVIITTRLQHKSGQFMESDITIPGLQRERFDAQSVGSAITYGCRYALQSICCVPREDDDGNLATERGQKEAKAKKEVEVEVDSQIAEHERKVAPCLFYVWHKESDTFEVSQKISANNEKLMKEHWKVLKPFWNGAVPAVVLKPQELEDLKFYFEKKGVPLKELKSFGA